METYDLAIIGAGGSGLAGAMYAARLGMKTIVFGATHGSELPVGGVITTTHLVENYPGFKEISGVQLARNLEAHARAYNEVTIKQEEVTHIAKNDVFTFETARGTYKAKTLLFATGTEWKKLDVPGSEEYANRGVHYCALCDAPLYKGKVVGVVGGSDSAVKDALVLSEHAKKVYVLYRGEALRAEPINLERLEKKMNVEVLYKTNVLKISGEQFVTSVELDTPYKNTKTLVLDGVFVAIGHVVLSGLAASLGVTLNEKKEIIIDHKTSETNIAGVFAAGDVTDKAFKQLITGVADACTAAFYAHDFLGKQNTK